MRGQYIPITAIGVTSMVFQLLVIRELLNIFSGLELVIGIILSNWLLLTGLGSLIKKRPKNNQISLLLGLIAVLPTISIILIRIARNRVFGPGEEIGIAGMFLFSIIILIPFCLLSGFLFRYACSLFSRSPKGIAKIYAIDTMGNIIGGLATSLILVHLFSTFQICAILILLDFGCIFLYERKRFALFSIGIFLTLALLFSNLDRLTTEQLYEDEIAYIKDSPYGQLVVTKDHDQLNFLFNSILMFSTDDIQTNEEEAHFPLSQVDSPENVLIISGGGSGIVQEIMKHSPKEIDYVELDPSIPKAAKELTTNLDSNVNIINEDPFLFILETNKKYDAIISNLPDPKNGEISRMYTVEFFRAVKERLSEGGVFSLSLEGYQNFITEEKSSLYSSIYNSLDFKNILLIPSGRLYMLASDSELSYEIGDRLSGIETLFVNNNYLPGILTEDRIAQAESAIDPSIPKNSLSKPIAYHLFLMDWLNTFGKGAYAIACIFLVLALLYILWLKAIARTVFFIGVSSAGLEMILLFRLWGKTGYSYTLVGLVFALFMLGLFSGSILAGKISQKSKPVFIGIAIVSLFTAIPALPTTLILASLFSAAFLSGYYFVIGSRALGAGITNSSDLIGSSIGALAISIILIPLAGLSLSAIIIALLAISLLLIKI